MVSTASKELKSLFGTYTINDVNSSNCSQICEVLSNAIKRSYGPEVRLDLHLNILYPGQVKEILTSYKENIVSLRILKDPEILLHLELPNIQSLDIFFRYVDQGLHKNICEAILARYGDKLEHLGIEHLKIPNNTVLIVPHLSQLKSLALNNISNNILHTFVDKVYNENITHLSLHRIRQDIELLDNLIFPKLQFLSLSDISADVALSLIECNKDTITKLKVFDFNLRQSDFGDIKIPNLQYLDLFYLPGDSALSLIKKNKDTLFEITLHIDDFKNTPLPVVGMPRLKRLYLNGYKSCELKLIKAFGRNIEELWSYDSQKHTYIRRSREELNNLKSKALALQ